MLAEKKLNMQELIVILVMHYSPGILQSKLIHFTGLDKGNFSKFLKRLEEKHYIYRKENTEMTGQNDCYLTEDGEVLVPYLKNTLEEWQTAIMSDIDGEALKGFNDVSKLISENLFEELDIKW